MKAEITITLTKEEFEGVMNKEDGCPDALIPCWDSYGQEDGLKIMGVHTPWSHPSRHDADYRLRVILEDGTDVTKQIWWQY